MNRNQHKAKAEELLAAYNNRYNAGATLEQRNYPERLIQLAQVHATLATVPDPIHSGLGPL